MEVGEGWIYRQSDSSPSERVTITAVHPKKQSVRVDVTFNDSHQENVPGSRLRGLWADVATYDERMTQIAILRDEYELLPSEDNAAWQVFELLIPEAVATIEWDPVQNATAVRNVAALEDLLGVKL